VCHTQFTVQNTPLTDFVSASHASSELMAVGVCWRRPEEVRSAFTSWFRAPDGSKVPQNAKELPGPSSHLSSSPAPQHRHPHIPGVSQPKQVSAQLPPNQHHDPETSREFLGLAQSLSPLACAATQWTKSLWMTAHYWPEFRHWHWALHWKWVWKGVPGVGENGILASGINSSDLFHKSKR